MCKLSVVFIVASILLAPSTQAGAYINLSAEMHNEASDSFSQRDGSVIKNVIGSVEVGYEFTTNMPISIFIRHSSSMQQEDTGLNSIGVKVRIQ